MKQIIQHLKTGKTGLEEIPAPGVTNGHVLIKTSMSLVSQGTEKMLVEFGKASLIQKARQQPDKVKMVLDKIKSDGLLPTIEAVFKKLDQPMPLGYCNVGRVIAVGPDVQSFKIGDRVASNGHHAEVVSIPQNLVAHIPENISDEEACFTVIGSIGLQGMRLLAPEFGETIVIFGLGLIGLITAELLLANGCKVIGLDLDDKKLEIAKSKGVIVFNPSEGDPVSFCKSESQNRGVDGVIITASSKSDQIISQAANMSRKRGRIILVGVIGLDIKRSDFYEKELRFQVSCSYGPGRYDETYEQKGQDYPLAYVRWTEKRNFEAILESISSGRIDVKPFISRIVPIENYDEIYSDLANDQNIASILNYSSEQEHSQTITITPRAFDGSKPVLGIIGAGNFTKMTLLPILKGSHIKYLASASGLNGTILAKKFQIAHSTTDYHEILRDPEVNLVIITTRHNLHSEMIIKSLQSGKHVFVEKPLTIDEKDILNIQKEYDQSQGRLSIGFNRRFSPHTDKVKSLLNDRKLKNIVVTINAGFIPEDSWVHDPQIGGGRILGEACHFLDLISYLSGSRIKKVCMTALGVNPETTTDNATILLKMANGDSGTIHYFANGNRSYPKEKLEVFTDGKILVIDNFRTTKAYGFKGFSSMKTKLDKGHKIQFKSLLDSISSGKPELISFPDIINVTKASFAAIHSLLENSWIEIQ